MSDQPFTDEEIAELTRLWNNLFSVCDDSITTLTYKAHGPARRKLLYAIRTTLPRLLDEREEMVKKIERLQAIVDKLPKTADGVHVTPAMELWVRQDGEILHFWATCINFVNDGWLVQYGSYDWYTDEDCYSSEEALLAAEAAQAKEADDA